jgi:endonuclease YncB( thermonuclease family)
MELCDEGDIILKSCGVGKYGRILGELYIQGANINNILLSEGHALPYNDRKT